MEFQTKIILLSLVFSCIIALIVIPILKKLKVGQLERKEGPQSHLKKQGTPTMGGIIIMITLLVIGALVCFTYIKSEDIENSKVASNLIPLIASTIGVDLNTIESDIDLLLGLEILESLRR